VPEVIILKVVLTITISVCSLLLNILNGGLQDISKMGYQCYMQRISQNVINDLTTASGPEIKP